MLACLSVYAFLKNDLTKAYFLLQRWRLRRLIAALPLLDGLQFAHLESRDSPSLVGLAELPSYFRITQTFSNTEKGSVAKLVWKTLY